MMLKLKLQYFGHFMQRVNSLEKTLMLGGIGGRREKGTTEDEMAGWHHWLDGHESEWTLGVGDVQGGLACCDSWGRKESDTTERLNWTEQNWRDNTQKLSLNFLIYVHRKVYLRSIIQKTWCLALFLTFYGKKIQKCKRDTPWICYTWIRWLYAEDKHNTTNPLFSNTAW